MSAHNVASPSDSAEPDVPPLLRAPALARLAGGTVATVQVEFRKLRRDPFDIFSRTAQPLLWLFLFGTAMAGNEDLAPAGVDYQAYITPGVMAQGALFVAIFFGLAIVWERDVGQLQRLLATPLPRLAIVLGKAIGAATRGLLQATLLLIVVAIAGIALEWSVLGVLGALTLLALGTGGFACLSLMLAALLRERERFMGVGQLITMPLFFASTALYPIELMPPWLEAVARVNPLTYEVQGIRECLLGVSSANPLWVDFAVVIAFFCVMAGIATRVYPRSVL